MEKTQFEILEQLKAAISAVREQLDILEARVSELELSTQETEPQDAVVPEEEPVVEPVVEPLEQIAEVPAEETPAIAVALAVEEPVEEPAPEYAPEPVPELVVEDIPVFAEDVEDIPVQDMPEEPLDLPVEEPAPEPEPEPLPEVIEEPDVEIVEEPLVEVPVEPVVEIETAEAPVPEEVIAESIPVMDEPFDITLDDDIDMSAISDSFASVEIEPVPEIVEEPSSVEPEPAPVEVDVVTDLEVVPEPAPEPEPVHEEPAAIEEPAAPAVEEEPAVFGDAVKGFPDRTLLIVDEDSMERVAPSLSINDIEKPKKAVMDIFSEKLRWKTDMPGTPVKNIVSAISLNDRALFINTLFRQNPLLFTNTIAQLNTMGSFEEALTYIAQEFPEWNMKGDGVYRFMMAVRRKLK